MHLHRLYGGLPQVFTTPTTNSVRYQLPPSVVGVKVVSLAERWTEGDDDQKPPLLGVASGLAAAEVRRLSRRTRAAHETARKNGKHVGRPFKNLSLLQEAARLVVSGECSIREAARRVSYGLPKKPEQPGGLSKVSAATVSRFLEGAWEGPGGPSAPFQVPPERRRTRPAQKSPETAP